MKGLVITGGDAPDRLQLGLPRERWFIVAADSGLETAERWDITPDLVVGDMDSVDPQVLERYGAVPREVHSRDKDSTDTELGLDAVWQRQMEDCSIAGGGGGRIDHFFGIARILERERYPRRWILPGFDLRIIDDIMEVPALIGEEVSFFPVGCEECRMKSTGLRWELTGLSWGHGDAGISNICVSERCTVEMLSGRLLMVTALQGPVVLD